MGVKLNAQYKGGRLGNGEFQDKNSYYSVPSLRGEFMKHGIVLSWVLLLLAVYYIATTMDNIFCLFRATNVVVKQV